MIESVHEENMIEVLEIHRDHDKKTTENATPSMAARPDAARVEPWLVPDVVAGLPEPVVAWEAAPEVTDVAKPVVGGAAVVLGASVGRPVKRAALAKVWQLDEEGMRAVYGIVEIGPSSSGGWV